MESTQRPVCYQLGPCLAEVEEGKSYLWCTCGRSTSQPFCDNESHKETGFLPLRYVASATTTIFFCGCKASCIKPLCDNTHARLAGYEGQLR